jgi:hypothetical protein
VGVLKSCINESLLLHRSGFVRVGFVSETDQRRPSAALQWSGGRMMMKLQAVLRFGVLFVLVLSPRSAHAVPQGDISPYDSLLDVPFNIGSGHAEVDSQVYTYTSGDYIGRYLYTYQITNVDSAIGLMDFSVCIIDGANAYALDVDPVLNCIAPSLWEIADPPFQTAAAHFTTAITDGHSSSLLSYVSDYAPGFAEAALFGTFSGSPYYTEADLLAPVPEPYTLVLLAIGAMILAKRNRQKP